MQHRDEIIIKKILSEIDIAETMIAGIVEKSYCDDCNKYWRIDKKRYR